jgi:hypothetical protein
MKKALTFVLVAIMVLSMTVVFAGASDINYAAANNGDVLYEVNFNGDAYYQPRIWRLDDYNKRDDVTITVSDGGKTATLKASDSFSGGKVFWGGAIGGLKLAEGNQYTITFSVKYTVGKSGVYFNIGYPDANRVVPSQEFSYNGVYGFFGDFSGETLTLSRQYSTKLNGENGVSKSSAYTAPSTLIPKDQFVDVKISIDGFYYSVWFRPEGSGEYQLYDSLDMRDKNRCPWDPCDNIGFSIGNNTNNGEITVKNVVVKKACGYTAAAHSTYVAAPIQAAAINYAAAQDGAKLADLLFDGSNPAFPATTLVKNASESSQISADGKTYTVSIGGTAAQNWFGSTIGQLKIADGNKYTFKYKIKAANSDATETTIAGVVYNSLADGLGNRVGWYGNFSETQKKYEVDKEMVATCARVMAGPGTTITGYGYDSKATQTFLYFTPAIDADGYVDVAVEYNGWTVTYYELDKNGKYQALQTIDLKTIFNNRLGISTIYADNLAFFVYTTNKNISASVKDAVLYKGNTVAGAALPISNVSIPAPPKASGSTNGELEHADHPIPGAGAQVIWTGHDFMYEGEPDATSPWSNAWTNGEAWTGLTFTAAEVDGVECVAVVPAYMQKWEETNGYSTEPLWDFNWYQWDNNYYYPSLDCSQYSVVAIRYMYNESGAAHCSGTKGRFWASRDSKTLGKTAGEGDYKKYTRAAETFQAGVWYTDYYDLSSLMISNKPWAENTLRQFRMFPFGGKVLLDGTEICYVQYVGFFKTMAEAQAFVDPKTVAADPGTVDTDEVVEPDVTAAPETQPTTPTTNPSTPATSDLGVVIAAVAAVSAGAAIIVSRKRRK